MDFPFPTVANLRELGHHFFPDFADHVSLFSSVHVCNGFLEPVAQELSLRGRDPSLGGTICHEKAKRVPREPFCHGRRETQSHEDVSEPAKSTVVSTWSRDEACAVLVDGWQELVHVLEDGAIGKNADVLIHRQPPRLA